MLQLRGRAIAWAGIFMLAACQPPTPNGKTSVSKSDIEKAIPPAMGSEREAEKTKAKAEPAGEKAAKVEAAAEPTQSEVEKVEAAGDAPAVAEKAPEEEEAKAPEAASEPLLAASKGEVMGLPYMQADLPNGLRAIAVRTDTPDVVSLQIAVRTGSRNEVEPGKSGFAHFFEHMMFRGTEKYPPDVYLDILKKAGADQNAYTSDDLTNYHITFTKADLDQVLEVESDRFQNLAYTEDQFRTEALAVKGEYLKNYSNPVRKMFERIRSLAFTTHPYRHTTLGFFEDIEKMPDQMEYSKTFFDRWYRPNNTVMVIVGDIDPYATVKKVAAAFGSWEKKDVAVEIPTEPAPEGPKHAHIKWDSPTQPWLLLAFRGPAFDAGGSTSAALDALETLAFSEASPLYQKIVIDEQLADEMWAWFPRRRDPHLFHIAVRLLDAKNATPVRDAIYAALAELAAAPVASTWVERTRSRLRYELASELDDASSTGDALASLVHFERTPETLDALFDSYGKVTPADVQQVARTYFTDDRRFLVTLGNEDTLPDFDPARSLAATASTAPSSFFAGAPAAVATPAVATSTTSVEVRHELMPAATSPLVTLSYVFTAGAAYDPPGKKGLAALTAAMIADGGTRDLTLSQINEAMYPMAASFSGQVDKEMIRFSGTVHRDNLRDFHAFAAAQLTQPGFRPEDLERNKKQLISAIKTDLVGDNDEELAKEVLYAEIYGANHPYGSYNLGSAESVEALTLEDVKAFYKRHFRRTGVIVGLAGAYPTNFLETVTGALTALPEGSDAVLSLQAPPSPEGRQALIIEKKTPGIAVSAGFPISVRRGDPDWVALWLARSWLGEHRSTNGNLYQEIREQRGMNYGDYAYIEYFPRGMFRFHPDANLVRSQQIFQLWLRPFRNNADAHFGTRLAVDELELLVKNGLTEQQFEATRSYLRKFVALLTQSQARRLGYGIDSDVYGIPEFATYVRRGLDALTVDTVNAAIRKHLDPSKLRFVFVTRDAASLLRKLARDMPSTVGYNTPKPALAPRDNEIANKKLGFDSVTFKPVSEVF